MKKGLSVLLIAAALFGFYGGATSLTDILASKDYWEEQGEKSTADMNKLEDGLNQLKDNEKAYLDGQKTLADGEKQLADAEVQLEEGRATLAQGYADYAAAPAKLRAGEAAIAQGEKDYADGEKKLATAQSLLSQLKAGVAELNDPNEGYPAWKAGINLANKNPQIDQFKTNGSLDGKKISAFKKDLEDKEASLAPLEQAYAGLTTISSGLQAAKDIPIPEEAPPKESPLYPAWYAVQQLNVIYSNLSSAGLPVPKPSAPGSKGSAYIDDCATYQAIIDQAAKQKSAESGGTDQNLAELMATIRGGIENCDNLLKLVAGKKKMQDKLLPLLDQVKGNAQVEEKLGDVDKIIAGLKGNDMVFMATMDNIMAAAPGLIATVAQAVHDGQNDLAAGAAKLAAGKRELAQGYADYAAAPGKLADGEKQLADGEKQYADGKKQLEDGKKKLAEYEDGEQQVRDGLATLMATKADPGLESILDRSNGDDKFDDANGHLQLDKGLEAVDTGRGYQADSGELITKEITNRAVGTAAGLGAAALAVLAAILSFLKKSKGAAVSAVLAAVAGGIGAGVGLSAGEYYSDIAGSTIGNTPFIAAAVLAAVAAVFAIVHFTAKPEAK